MHGQQNITRKQFHLLLIYTTKCLLMKRSLRIKGWNVQNPNKNVCVCVCEDVCLLALVRHWLSAITFCHTKPCNNSGISLRQEQRLYLGRCCWLTPRTPSVGRPSPTNTAIRAATHDRCHWTMSALTPLTTLMHIRGSTVCRARVAHITSHST